VSGDVVVSVRSPKNDISLANIAVSSDTPHRRPSQDRTDRSINVHTFNVVQ
jgi:hypothetical protein